MSRRVKLYSTSTCPSCNMAKEFLKGQKVEFEDVDVENDEEAVKEMVQKSGRTALPVIDIDGQIIVGFDKVAIVKALRK